MNLSEHHLSYVSTCQSIKHMHFDSVLLIISLFGIFLFHFRFVSTESWNLRKKCMHEFAIPINISKFTWETRNYWQYLKYQWCAIALGNQQYVITINIFKSGITICSPSTIHFDLNSHTYRWCFIFFYYTANLNDSKHRPSKLYHLLCAMCAHVERNWYK